MRHAAAPTLYPLLTTPAAGQSSVDDGEGMKKELKDIIAALIEVEEGYRGEKKKEEMEDNN